MPYSTRETDYNENLERTQESLDNKINEIKSNNQQLSDFATAVKQDILKEQDLSTTQKSKGLESILTVLNAHHSSQLHRTAKNNEALLMAMENLKKFETSVEKQVQLNRNIERFRIAVVTLVVMEILVASYLTLCVFFPPAVILPVAISTLTGVMGMTVPGTAGLLTVSSLVINAAIGTAGYFAMSAGIKHFTNPERAYNKALENLRITVAALEKNDSPSPLYDRFRANLGLQKLERPGAKVITNAKVFMNEIRTIKMQGNKTESLESLTRGLNILNIYLNNPANPKTLKTMEEFTTAQPPNSQLYTVFTKVIVPVLEVTLITGILIYVAGLISPPPLNTACQAVGSALLTSGIAAWTIPFLPVKLTGGAILPQVIAGKGIVLAEKKGIEAVTFIKGSQEKSPSLISQLNTTVSHTLISPKLNDKSVNRFKRLIIKPDTTVSLTSLQHSKTGEARILDSQIRQALKDNFRTLDSEIKCTHRFHPKADGVYIIHRNNYKHIKEHDISISKNKVSASIVENSDEAHQTYMAEAMFKAYLATGNRVKNLVISSNIDKYPYMKAKLEELKKSKELTPFSPPTI